MTRERAERTARRRSGRRLLAVAAVVTACAHSPEPTFYALSPRGGSAFETRPLVIELRRPTLPPYLDRQYIVRRATSERLALDGGARWAAPLQELVAQTLSEDLASRLPRCFVVREASPMVVDADVRLDIAISRFEVDPEGAAELSATFAVRSGAGKQPALYRYDTQVPSNTSARATAASLSEALGRLSDEVARGVAGVSPAHAANGTIDARSVRVSDAYPRGDGPLP